MVQRNGGDTKRKMAMPSKVKAMNWIILVIAGLFEVAFAFCIGKAKETTGN